MSLVNRLRNRLTYGWMATIYDIARLARVSTATVSHVINATRKVSPDTARRVRDAMAATNYRPNTLARGLRTRHSGAIGLIVPDLTNPFHALIARSVEQRCYAASRTVVICSSNYDPARERAHVEALWGQRIDGLLLAPARRSSPGLRLAHELGLPTVVVDNECDGMTNAVTSNNVSAGAIAARYLLDLGHRNVACVACEPGWTATSDQRVAGFSAALAAAGCPLGEDAIAYADFQKEGGLAAMASLLGRGIPMTAVFACNDLMAAGAMVALYRAAVRIPDEISVIGVDDCLQSLLTVPPLTSVKQDVDEFARHAITLLDGAVTGGAAARHIVLDVAMVERESCGPAAAALLPPGAVQASDAVGVA